MPAVEVISRYIEYILLGIINLSPGSPNIDLNRHFIKQFPDQYDKNVKQT